MKDGLTSRYRQSQGLFVGPNIQFVSELKMNCPEETAKKDYNSDILFGREC